MGLVVERGLRREAHRRALEAAPLAGPVREAGAHADARGAEVHGRADEEAAVELGVATEGEGRVVHEGPRLAECGAISA